MCRGSPEPPSRLGKSWERPLMAGSGIDNLHQTTWQSAYFLGPLPTASTLHCEPGTTCQAQPGSPKVTSHSATCSEGQDLKTASPSSPSLHAVVWFPGSRSFS